ncbi:MAG: M56 family metallopeptidase, partial [Chloroflexota bacterium]
MTKRAKLSYRLFFIGLLTLILACAFSDILCNWVMTWCNSSISIKQMSFAAVLCIIFAFTIIRQIWKTYQYTQQFLYIVQVNFPIHAQDVIANLGIDISKVILVESSVPIAFCFGFFRPQICLSTGILDLLSTSQLRATLCHEDFHRRHFDPLRILLIESISTALFFLPAIREWRSLVKIKLELDADEYAALKVGKPALAGALHRLLTHPTKSRPVQGTVTVGLSANTARIAALLGERDVPQHISR